MDLIKIKVGNLQKLNDSISKLSDDISKFYSFKLNVCDNIIDDISDISNTVKKIDNISNTVFDKTSENFVIPKLYELWHLCNSSTYKVEEIINTIDKVIHVNLNVIHITDVQFSFISDLYNNLNKLFQKFQTDNKEVDINIIKFIETKHFDSIKISSSNILIDIETYTKLLKLYPFSISLFAFMMQLILFRCIPLGDQVCNIVIDNIESAKDFIMLDSVKIKLNSKSIHKSNPHIKTFGLTPNGKAKSLKLVIGDIFKQEEKVKNETGLESLAKKNNICIVVLNRIINKPIEFSLWNLIDWKYSQPFLQSEFAGVNKKMIERFNTLAFIEIDKYQKWNFDINYYGKLESEYFIIIEKLSDDIFRLLNIYDRESDINKIRGGGSYETKIHKKHITYFIEYVKNNGIISDNTRISEYHKIQEKNILKNLFLPSRFNTKSISARSQIIDSKYLRYAIQKQLIIVFNEIIKKEYKNGALIKTNKDIGTIMHHPNLSDVFNSIIIEQYDIYTFKNKENISQFPYSETLKTFIAEISLISRNFVRDIHTKFISTKINQIIFIESNEKKISYLNDMFIIIIDAVLLKIISDESNIYQTLLYKNSLLQLSLI